MTYTPAAPNTFTTTVYGTAGQTLTFPMPVNVCSIHMSFHRYRCEAVKDDLTVVMCCECGKVIRDYPEKPDEKT